MKIDHEVKVPDGNIDPDRGFQQRMRKVMDLAGNGVDLAKKTGIARRTIGHYLSGQADPTRLKLIALANAVGVSVEWLATGKEPMRPGDQPVAAEQPPAGPSPMSEEDWRLLRDCLYTVEEVAQRGGHVAPADFKADLVRQMFERERALMEGRELTPKSEKGPRETSAQVAPFERD